MCVFVQVERAQAKLVELLKETLTASGLGDGMAAALLGTKTAALQLPGLAVARDAHQVMANAASLVEELPGHSRHRASLVGALTRDLSQPRAGKALGVTKSSIKHSRRSSTQPKSSTQALSTEKYEPGVTKVRVPENEALFSKRYAAERMHVSSGTYGEVYTLVGMKKTFYGEYRGDYLAKILIPLVKYEPSLRAAEGTSFDDMTCLQRGLEVAAREAGLEVANDLPLGTDCVKPRSERVFWKMLKDSGLRFRQVTVPYECPVCLYGPEVKLDLPRLRETMVDDKARLAEIARLPSTKELQRETEKLLGDKVRHDIELRSLTKKEKALARHKRQYAVQRPFLKSMEKGLKPAECIVYEDFVCSYDINGRKVYNLVFTIVTMEGGQRKVRWLNNYCTDRASNKADWLYVRDVWDHNLKSVSEGGTGEFDEFDRIIRSGDSGPHFHNHKMIWFESCIQKVQNDSGDSGWG